MDAANEHPNASILAAANARGWFVARKVAPVWARELTEATIVKTREGPLEAQAGDYLCRGPDGGRWPQSEASLRQKYEPTEEIDDAGFRRWTPQREKARVFASEVAEDLALATSWGVMRGVAGDFLVRRHSEAVPGPDSDLWIVDRATFGATYEREDAPAGA